RQGNRVVNSRFLPRNSFRLRSHQYDTKAMAALLQEPWDLGLVYVPEAGLVPEHCTSITGKSTHEGYYDVQQLPIRSQAKNRPVLNLWVAASVLVLASLSVSSPALPRSNFNGDWSVIVQSRGGACAPTVRYPVAITNGVVTNGGETPATVQGRVAPNVTTRSL